MMRNLALFGLLGLANAAPGYAPAEKPSHDCTSTTTSSHGYRTPSAKHQSGSQGKDASKKKAPSYGEAKIQHVADNIVLKPGYRPDHALKDLKHLKPTRENKMYYTPGGKDEDSKKDHAFADLDAIFNYPTVVLDDSAYIHDTKCDGNDLKVRFDDKESFDHAKKEWTAVNEKFILVTSSNGCEEGKDGQRTYWVATDVKYDEKKYAAFVECDKVDIKDAISRIDMVWGKYKNNPSPTANSKAGTTAAPHVKRGFFDDVGNWVKNAGENVQDALEQGASASTNIAINAKPTDVSSSPWGIQQQLYSGDSVNVYCVDCGARGNVELGGALGFSIADLELSKGEISLEGNMNLNMGLGLESHELSKSFEPYNRTLFTQGIPGLSITDIFTIGPSVTLQAKVGLKLSTSSEILAAVDMSWSNFNAKLDLVNEDGTTSSGWTPKVEPSFKAEGEVSATASFGLPISIDIGINIVPLGKKGKYQASLSNTPSLELEAKYANNATGKDCKDIDWEFRFTDSTDVTVIEWSKNLASWNPSPIADGCLKVPGVGPP